MASVLAGLDTVPAHFHCVAIKTDMVDVHRRFLGGVCYTSTSSYKLETWPRLVSFEM